MSSNQANRVVKIGVIYEELENLHNLLQVCVDAMAHHNVLELDSVKQVLLMATDKAWGNYTTAKDLHDEMLAVLKDGAK
ncbi:hypothetical protein [Thiothrix fructosivorans]|uniref:Uncharacterized protein n=1 Tax=Thiothrix fructosivorans TaxID=111770 RepID=A0A8B0SMK8_9GAMM|nr:hypothetical protein [Thiothrix fructosivorans]MBO0615389.1 hypothetical protein [Thiothrix fructosivorans]QTX10162.1 hypothetical protein J1836_016440 [Thiothrix fructosivorans]